MKYLIINIIKSIRLLKSIVFPKDRYKYKLFNDLNLVCTSTFLEIICNEETILREILVSSRKDRITKKLIKLLDYRRISVISYVD